MMELLNCLNTTNFNMSIMNNTCYDDVNLNTTFNACMLMKKIKMTKSSDLKMVFSIIVITSSLLIWSVLKIVKLCKKFLHENVEPAIILELVFLTNFSALFGSFFLLNVSGLSSYGYLDEVACSLFFLARVSFYADLCLIYLDKFVALYWSTEYNDLVTKSKAIVACFTTKSATLLWTIIFNSVYRYKD